MLSFENYTENIDVEDKYNIKNINVNTNVTFRGPYKTLINKSSKENNDFSQEFAAAVLGLNNTSTPLFSKHDHGISWNDIDTQEIILNTKPSCYLILGKPGSGAFNLGEALSKKLKCVHICPKKILIDEINQKSSTGLCLEFNMRHNNVVQFEHILSVMKKKLNSSSIKHRGYVISGLPLVTSNRSSRYLFNSFHGEESVLVISEMIHSIILNLKKKPNIVKDLTSTSQSSVTSDIPIIEEEEALPKELEGEENIQRQEELPVELPKFILDSCSDIIFHNKSYIDSKKSTLLKQFKELITLDIAADIIIYLSCPDIDLITIKLHKCINYPNDHNSTIPFRSKFDIEIRWPVKYIMDDYVKPYDVNIFNYKYSCRQPINYKEQSTEQICNYKLYIFPYVEKTLADFNPKCVIKLDARISVHEMMNNLMERFVLLPIEPVHVPEPLLLEEESEDMDEFWDNVQEQNVIQNGVLRFSSYPSPWFNRCPVELKFRQSVCGNSKYAVSFMKHIYLLSSLSNMTSFCSNPRPFLKLKYLEPTCRIIILGTKSSGKTLIAECLSWIFDTPIISYKIFLENEKQRKIDYYEKTILAEIIGTIEDKRFETWQNTELERYSELETWCNSTLEILRQYVTYLKEYLKYQKQEEKNKEQQQDQSDLGEMGLDPEILNSFINCKTQLSFLPFLESRGKCKQALIDKNIVLQFAPAQLKTMTEKPVIPALGDEDVKQAISDYIIANDLQKEMQPTTEEIMNAIIKILSDLDTKCRETSNFEQCYSKFIIDGFPSDPEFWGYLSDSKLLPDYTIALIENKELDTDLIEYYLNIENIEKNYPKTFLLATDPLVKIKLSTAKLPDLKDNVNTVIKDVINKTCNKADDNEDISESDSFTTIFAESIEKFHEEWDIVKAKLEDNYKCFIEVDLDNKTDIQIIDEVLLGVRKSYSVPCESNDEEHMETEDEDVDDIPNDLLTYNHPQFLGDTNIYCPISYYEYGVLWEGKPDYCIKFNNRVHYFCKAECLTSFQNDFTKYQSLNKPYKQLPPLRICVVGSIGSGKTVLSKYLAKELGLIHIDLVDLINNYLMPRHFKKVGRLYENIFTDNSLDEEAVSEFQMSEDYENLISGNMFNENELRRMVYNYFEIGTPILSVLMHKIIKTIWFENPFLATGIILDGYPRLPNDLEDMLSCFCIPDLIINLECSAESSLSRVSPIMFKIWKTQLREAKNKAKAKLDIEKQKWMEFITKNIVVKLIYDEILDNIFFSEPINAPSKESLIIDANPLETFNVSANLLNTYNLMIQDFPEPIDENEWENPDDVLDRIDTRIENIYEIEERNVKTLKDLLFENKIKVASINATKPVNKVIRIALKKLTKVRNRCQSFFEQTFIIELDIAEVLLTRGIYFLSKFYRLCPVFIFENPTATFNPYKIYGRKRNVFPVIHRSYIYFIAGGENVKKFRSDPLKYVDCDTFSLCIEYPLRIGIIGPPKSGKSELAEKLAKKYGLICISKGMAIRKILDTMNWTELASKIMKLLLGGNIIDPYLIMKSIQTASFNHRMNTYGCVFDGFPDTALDATELNKQGLYPNIIFDISTSKINVLKRSQQEIYYDIIKIKPPYSIPFIQNRYLKWTEDSENIRNWINDDYQNLYILNGDNSRWQCLQEADSIIYNIISKVHYYFTNEKSTIVPVHGMCISNEIFQQRMSQYKNMCPLCLCSNILKHAEYPIDRKGIVQFKNKFYWFCGDHINAALKNPLCIMTEKKIDIPEIPAVVKTVNMNLVYENGICIVTYAENLPCQTIETGTNKYAASYQGKTYLFCTPKCLEIFLSKPHMFCDIEVFKERKLLPSLSVDKLPNLGYLEQTIGNILTNACCSVNIARPKYPGLNIQISGLLYIALYLKTHHTYTDQIALAIYEKAFKVYEAKCKLIVDVGLRLRSMDNPFAKYPLCCSKLMKLNSESIRIPSSSVISFTSTIFDSDSSK